MGYIHAASSISLLSFCVCLRVFFVEAEATGGKSVGEVPRRQVRGTPKAPPVGENEGVQVALEKTPPAQHGEFFVLGVVLHYSAAGTLFVLGRARQIVSVMPVRRHSRPRLVLF